MPAPRVFRPAETPATRFPPLLEGVDYCKGRIAHFKIPQDVRIVESLPMTVSGKIQKYRIREMEIEAHGLHAQITTIA